MSQNVVNAEREGQFDIGKTQVGQILKSKREILDANGAKHHCIYRGKKRWRQFCNMEIVQGRTCTDYLHEC